MAPTDLPLPAMYDALASWWPLLSAPEDYAEEAALYLRVLREASARPAETLLELGSGGGNNASHLKRHFRAVTLTDPAPGMLEVSRRLNPECEHVRGDMRDLRLGRRFDRVFVHDAVMYMTTEDDLRRAVATAYLHCEPGGAAVFAPDWVRETFRPGTDCGGHDGADGRGLRYLEWSRDPDPAGTTLAVDYAYLLREADGSTRAVHDRHLEGLFSRDTWLALLADAGFRPRVVPVEHSEVDWALEAFVAERPG